jgi:hypothetical protein
MIVFLTTANHTYTISSICNGKFGFPTPTVVVESYGTIVRRPVVERATYIFADLERLAPYELRIAAGLFRALRHVGLRTLNDPAHVKLRYEFLKEMNRTGINPFTAYRADDESRPERFPVFVRSEDDHLQSDNVLLKSQMELDTYLSRLRTIGVPLKGLLVIEFCPSVFSGGLWNKWGAFGIGTQVSLDHMAVDDTWLVKYGRWEKLTDQAVADEYDAVLSNRFSGQVSRVLQAASIDFGRADFGMSDGQPVFYEINTNPYIGDYVPDPKELRRRTQELARRRFAQALEQIDCSDTGTIEVPVTSITKPIRSTAPGHTITGRP